MTNQRRNVLLDSVLRDDRSNVGHLRVMRAFWTTSRPIETKTGARVFELAAYADANALRRR